MVDFHHSTTSRPATEETALSMYVDEHDVMSAEFVRLYRSQDFYGSVLLRALEREEASHADSQASARRMLPKIKDDIGDAEIMLRSFDDLYGYRPRHQHIFYLSPWEFTMWWEVLPADSARDAKTTHVIILQYPQEPQEAAELRKKFVLGRRVRPMVPSPSHTPMPDRVPETPEVPERRAEQQCRLYSVYMRAWTKIHSYASDHVPHLSKLDVLPPRCRQWQKSVSVRSFASTWSWYLRGNIVSTHQKRLIVAFMSLNCGKSTQDNYLDDPAPDSGASRQPYELKNEFCVTTVHGLVKKMSAGAQAKGEDSADASTSMASALRIGEAFWGLGSISSNRTVLSPSCVLKSSARKQTTADVRQGGVGSVKAKARVNPYVGFSIKKRQAWFRKLLDPKLTEEVPNEKQQEFICAVINRCEEEAMDYKRGTKKQRSEPQNMALLAPPGTGKTFCIKLACQYFKEVFDWSPGVEFQCAASQNRMSGRIGGNTLHSWGEVPIDVTAAATQDKKKSKKTQGSMMYNKCISLRWLIIDEVSTASLHVLGTLEKNLSKATIAY